VNQRVTADFPKPSGLFTIQDVGGWDEVTKRFFDKQTGILVEIERKVGVSVGS
jgi:sulfate transport system substrate-binding protein